MSPIGVIDQNAWTEYKPGVMTELVTAFRGQAIYTPFVQWAAWGSEAQTTYETELVPLDVSAEEIPMTANYLPVEQPFDSRMRRFSVARYGKLIAVEVCLN